MSIYVAGWGPQGETPHFVIASTKFEFAKEMVVNELRLQFKHLAANAAKKHTGPFETGPMLNGYNYFVHECT